MQKYPQHDENECTAGLGRQADWSLHLSHLAVASGSRKAYGWLGLGRCALSISDNDVVKSSLDLDLMV